MSTQLRTRTLVILAATVALLAATRVLEAGEATEQIKSTAERILKLLRDPDFRKPGKTEETRKQIRAIADESFDWEEISRRVLGRYWRDRTPSEREEFSRLFADLLEQTYLGKIERYSGERLSYAGESIEGDLAVVKTKFITKSNTEVPIEYRVIKEGNRWRIYDVVIEGVSLVSNYRTQFNRVIQQAGYAELIKRLKTRKEEFRTGGWGTS